MTTIAQIKLLIKAKQMMLKRKATMQTKQRQRAIERLIKMREKKGLSVTLMASERQIEEFRKKRKLHHTLLQSLKGEE